MSKKNRNVAIIGCGMSKFSSHREEVNQPEMIFEAVEEALKDAGITIDDVDCILHGNMDSSRWSTSPTCGTPSAWASAARPASASPPAAPPAPPSPAPPTTSSPPASTTSSSPSASRSSRKDTPPAASPTWPTPSGPQDPGRRPHRHHRPDGHRRIRRGTRQDVRHADARHHGRARRPQRKGPPLLRPRGRIHEGHGRQLAPTRRRAPSRIIDMCSQSDGACAVLFCSEEKVKQFQANPAWSSTTKPSTARNPSSSPMRRR